LALIVPFIIASVRCSSGLQMAWQQGIQVRPCRA
jgi:hypothetical protein